MILIKKSRHFHLNIFLRAYLFALISLYCFFQVACANGLPPSEGGSSDFAIIPIDKSQKAFPSAEGYGAFSKGGRGGEVIYVTNLNDSGPGSLREALIREGARTVLFSVSGIIELNSTIFVGDPFLTIAGETAPGGGITLKNGGIYIAAHDVIIRHLRIRPGDSTIGQSYDDRDAITIGQRSYSIMIDHVSATWAIDENISTFYGSQSITIQWSIIGEALHNSFHPEGPHSKALLVGDNTKLITIHHNVFAHNDDRTPAQIKGNSICDVVNNIVYNWGTYAYSFNLDYVLKPCFMNLRSNYFLKGPSSTGDFFSEAANAYGSKLYIGNNLGDDPLLMSYNANPAEFISQKDYLVASPIDWPGNVNITGMETETLRNVILDNAGATLPVRDEVDTRIINDVKNISGAIIDSPASVGGYPFILEISEDPANYDSDLDGMPNNWEDANGFDSSSSADGNGDHDGDGYTNLEEYLQSLVYMGVYE
ncbi:MAG: hypothetical protein JXA95_07365 [Spirochaetales bacterium]|nr:hypothetical protein [Spirochaetales bacterium]